ncbi:uncharacterized protein BDV17DRAFT_262730 [Aspergillus undulatus]|uniref:uncharacterized protein n=1 Tax=Aspergillus undulatus TaxID=1810928 RepID=UPI003CCD30C9
MGIRGCVCARRWCCTAFCDYFSFHPSFALLYLLGLPKSSIRYKSYYKPNHQPPTINQSNNHRFALSLPLILQPKPTHDGHHKRSHHPSRHRRLRSLHLDRLRHPLSRNKRVPRTGRAKGDERRTATIHARVQIKAIILDGERCKGGAVPQLQKK